MKSRIWPKLNSGSPEDEYPLKQIAALLPVLELDRVDEIRVTLCDMIVEAFRAGFERGTNPAPRSRGTKS